MPLVWAAGLGSISIQASKMCHIKIIFFCSWWETMLFKPFVCLSFLKGYRPYSTTYQHHQFSIQINERWFFFFCKMLHFKYRLIGCFSTKELLKKKAFHLFYSEHGVSEFSRKCMPMWQRIRNVLMSTLHNCHLIWNRSHLSWSRYVFLGFLLAWFQHSKCLWRQLFFYQGKSF